MFVGHQQTQTSPSFHYHQVPVEHSVYHSSDPSSQIPMMISSVHSSDYSLNVGQYIHHPYACHPSVATRLPVSPEEENAVPPVFAEAPSDEYPISATTIRSIPNHIPAVFHQEGRHSPIPTHGSIHSRHSSVHVPSMGSIAGCRDGSHHSYVSPVGSNAGVPDASIHSYFVTLSVHVPVHSGSVHGHSGVLPHGSSSPLPQYFYKPRRQLISTRKILKLWLWNYTRKPRVLRNYYFLP